MIQLLQTLKFKSLFLIRYCILFAILFTGQQLLAQTTVVRDTVISFYTVKSGDNLSTIAARNGITLGFLCRTNGHNNSADFKLAIGNKIKIPKLVSRVVQQTIIDTSKKETQPVPTNVVKIEPKLSFADSLINYKAILQHKEDSLFLLYVELDKKKDSMTRHHDSMMIANQAFQKQQDSIEAFAQQEIKALKYKDSIDVYVALIAQENERAQFIKDSIEAYKIDLAQKDSINKYHDFLIIENEKKQLAIDSMNNAVNEAYNSIRIKDSINTYSTLHAKDMYVSITNEVESTGNKIDSKPPKPKVVKQTKEATSTTKVRVVEQDKTPTSAKLHVVKQEKVVQGTNKTTKNPTKINKTTQVSKSQHKKNVILANKDIEDDKSSKDSSLYNTLNNIQNSKSRTKYKIGDVIKETDLQKSSFLLIRAMKAIDAKDYGNAQSYLNKSLHLNPNYTEAYIMLADMYATFNYYDKAVKEYDKAILTNKTMPVLYYNRGSNYLKMNELNKSFSDFNKAIQLDTQYVLALGGRASIYILKKEYKQALNDLNTIIELNAFFAPAYKARAEARLAIGDFKGTIEDCNKYLESNNDDAYVYYQRGMARINEGEYYNSCIDLLKAVELGYTQANLVIKKYCK